MFIKHTERVWAEHNIVFPSFTWLPDNEDGTSNGALTGQRSNKPGEVFDFFRSLYTDDGAFMFASRDMITDTSLLHTHLQRFGMLMHVGSRATETIVKAASLRSNQYISPIEILLLMKSNQIPLILT